LCSSGTKSRTPCPFTNLVSPILSPFLSTGTTKRIGVDFICVEEESGELEADFSFSQVGGMVSTLPVVNGGSAPYTYAWDFGDSSMSSEAAPTYSYTTAGTFTLSLTVTDGAGVSVGIMETITITDYMIPVKMGDYRVATFNLAFSDAFPDEGEMEEALKTPGNPAIMGEASVIKHANPDIVFLNEWNGMFMADGTTFDEATTKQGVQDFIDNYLAMGDDAVTYEHIYVAACNTGVQSGFDLSRDGTIGDGGDGFGFGTFPGRYSMAVISKFPINMDKTRTFQYFLWKDMPGAYLPPDPMDVDMNGDMASYYTMEELAVYRLSSKSHWDVVIDLPDGEMLHLLGSHPTPPVFDDGTATEYPSTEFADFNGYRNHDEIRFWWDYIDPEKGSYIYDDAEFMAAGGTPGEPSGGLSGCERFVLVGDQNADPLDGDATLNPAASLIGSAFTNDAMVPMSPGAVDFGLSDEKTSEFGLRVDYTLPSVVGWDVEQSFVYWPINTDLQAPNVVASVYGSDHRMVVVDLTAVAKVGGSCPEVTTTDAPVAAPSAAVGVTGGLMSVILAATAWFLW
jgi:PKD repeat protein